MIVWPQQLIEDIARRRAILFLGSGVSKNSVSELDNNVRPPTWEEFLRAAVARCGNPKRHIEALLSRHDYLTACEIIKYRLADEWNALIHDLFVAPKFRAADIHRDIFQLDSRIVLTQNVDRIYDSFAANESSGTVYVKEYSNADVGLVVRGDRRCVLKAHGSVDTPARMIFTREDYIRARVEHSPFYGVLDALSVTHTLLFVGCGLSDPDVQLMLEKYAYVFPGSRPHYMVAPRASLHVDIEQSHKRNMNLKFLFYRAQDGHAELRESLHDLVGLVETQRELLASTRNW
ncbi:hypothetical protein HNQ60_005109 [Povalibacter uvarum]|uniref:SIR2-like domain-containing protein n=1 Tax=Povalibacter uvarum TaxID=732238 RepID=A0A841HSB5_9GAMM|nr:SIR2 family protein [Povalibacter uvarum]MBB6096187.1 hypothetical protein [Povalibacter uvarum]